MLTKIIKIRNISTKPVQQQRLSLVHDLDAVVSLVIVQKRHLGSLAFKGRLWIFIEEDIIDTVEFVVVASEDTEPN